MCKFSALKSYTHRSSKRLFNHSLYVYTCLTMIHVVTQTKLHCNDERMILISGRSLGSAFMHCLINGTMDA